MTGNYQAVGARRTDPCDEVGLRDAEQLDRLNRGLETTWRELRCEVVHRVAIAFCADRVERDESFRDLIQIIIHGGTEGGIQSEQSHNRRVDNKSMSYNIAEILMYSPMSRQDRQLAVRLARMLEGGGVAGWNSKSR